MGLISIDDSGFVASAIQNILEDEQKRAYMESRPSFILKPQLSIDGNQWCALYGESLQCGVAGFGDSPDEAYKDFDQNWYAKLKK